MSDYLDVNEIILDPVLVVSGQDVEVLPKASIKGAHFIVKNIAFDDELKYILSDSGLPLYYTDGIAFNYIGLMKPVLKSIFKAKFLDCGISFVNSFGIEKDLNLFENLIPFIDIGDTEGSHISVMHEIEMI